MNNTDEGLRIYEMAVSMATTTDEDVELLCNAVLELVAEVRRLRHLTDTLRNRSGVSV